MIGLRDRHTPLVRSAYLRDAPILSGAAGFGDRGWRGLANELQFIRAQKVQALAEGDDWANAAYFTETTSIWVDATEEMRVHVGRGVIALEVVADVEDGEIRVVCDGVTGERSGFRAGRAAHVAVVHCDAGASLVKIQVAGNNSDPTNLVSWQLRELPLLTPTDLLVASTQINTLWQLADVDTIEVTPRVSGHPAVIYARARGGILVPIEVFSAGLQLDVSGTGLGGMLYGVDEGDRGIDVYATTDGSTAELFGVGVDSSRPRLLDVRAVDNDYRCLTPRPVSLGANVATATDGSTADLLPYWQTDGEARYLSPWSTDTAVASTFTATSSTALNWTDLVPTSAREVVAMVVAANYQATPRNLRLERGDGSDIWTSYFVATANGYSHAHIEQVRLPLPDGPAASTYALWSGAVTTGGYVAARGWVL